MKPRIIVISGTPGTGKTSVARRVAEELGAFYVNLSELVIKEKLYTSVDEERGAYVADLDALEERLRRLAEEKGLLVVDSHYGEVAPPDLVDKVIVLRLDPEVLEKRLRERGWPEKKVKENVAAEVLGVCTVNAVEEQGEDKVYEVDVTGKSLDEVVAEVLRIIRGERGEPGARIDWLSRKPLEVIEKYLR